MGTLELKYFVKCENISRPYTFAYVALVA